VAVVVVVAPVDIGAGLKLRTRLTHVLGHLGRDGDQGVVVVVVEEEEE
jgi:hypothetical protein